MLTLGIETTCDETAIALVRDGKEILANLVSSQIPLHAPFGGVVPELASRAHVETCGPLLNAALKQCGITLEEIDLIAVAKGPGLIGALLVGVNFAKGLAWSMQKPLIGVNHVHAHLYACFMADEIPLPALGVVISGGHTALLHMQSATEYTLLGQTHDDAIGEAFDKVAAQLSLPYPGGPAVEKLALEGNPHRFPFKPGQMKGRPYDFSFSGLKTSVLYATRENALTEETRRDIAASFQRAALESIVDKALLAAKSFDCQSVVVGGGVSNNRALRQRFAKNASCPVFWPPQGLTLDNAAMIAGLGTHLFTNGHPIDGLALEALPRIPL